MQVATIGLDVAKNVFQVHGIDGKGRCQEAATAALGAGISQALIAPFVDRTAGILLTHW
jgi:hypothetical protein